MYRSEIIVGLVTTNGILLQLFYSKHTFYVLPFVKENSTAISDIYLNWMQLHCINNWKSCERKKARFMAFPFETSRSLIKCRLCWLPFHNQINCGMSFLPINEIKNINWIYCESIWQFDVISAPESFFLCKCMRINHHFYTLITL